MIFVPELAAKFEDGDKGTLVTKADVLSVAVEDQVARGTAQTALQKASIASCKIKTAVYETVF